MEKIAIFRDFFPSRAISAVSPLPNLPNTKAFPISHAPLAFFPPISTRQNEFGR
jgi:hypothetical protein